jgi:cellulose/xylan binding protein with CBM9 domain
MRPNQVPVSCRAPMPKLPEYAVSNVETAPSMDASWDAPAWGSSPILQVAHFRPEGSDHRPETKARLGYDDAGLHGIFHVRDRYVRCVRTNYFDEVWKDSCVEFFVQPRDAAGYFNFEFNCGGAFLCCYITNPERAEGGFKEFIKLPAKLGQSVKVRSSLPRTVDPEITEAVDWSLRFFIPFTLFETVLGKPVVTAGKVWRGNFFKCAEQVSHPHWASWAPVDEFNFHRPQCFGSLHFG